MERDGSIGQEPGPVWDPESQTLTTGEPVAPDAGAPVHGDGRAGPDAGAQRESTVVFVEEPKSLQRLIFWNTLSTFLTVGLYRFWARTRLRRHFWHRVIVAGSPAEYMGHGFELFAGFLVIFALVGVGFLVFLFSTLYAYGDEVSTDLLSSLPLALLPVLLPMALFRARRYRLRRTVWRGIHLAQDGSVLTYTALWVWGLVLTVLTLGLAYPARNLWTERYRLTHTLVGDRRVDFKARVAPLMLAWLPAWGCSLLLLAASVGCAVWWDLHGSVSDLPAGTNNPPVPEPWSDFYAVPPALWGLALLLSLILFYGSFVRYRVLEFRYVVGQMDLAGARFTSDLGVTDVLRIITPGLLGLMGYVVLSGVTVATIYEVLRALPSHAADGAGTLLMAASALSMSVALLFAASYGVSVVSNVGMRARLLGAVARTLDIENPQALDRIGQGRTDATGPGEGLADALAFGDF
ncbi:MAG: DUF898 family protein [Alphaproteobacteria bacterium]